MPFYLYAGVFRRPHCERNITSAAAELERRDDDRIRETLMMADCISWVGVHKERCIVLSHMFSPLHTAKGCGCEDNTVCADENERKGGPRPHE